jgi:hypothetical protein
MPSPGRPPGGTSTATYYDVLGVKPDASHEEVKRAYTARSLKHRATPTADDPRSVEEAAYRRRELDEAWSVLRSPGSRAAYDESLLDEDEEPEPEPKWVATGAWAGRDYTRRLGETDGSDRNGSGGTVWFTEPEVADIEPLDEHDDQPKRRRTAVGPLAIGAVALILVLIVLSRINNDRADVTIQTRERYPRGSCVDLQHVDETHTTATEVPCSGQHDGQVVDKVDIGSTCTPHTEYTELDSLGIVLCLKRST